VYKSVDVEKDSIYRCLDYTFLRFMKITPSALNCKGRLALLYNHLNVTSKTFNKILPGLAREEYASSKYKALLYNHLIKTDKSLFKFTQLSKIWSSLYSTHITASPYWSTLGREEYLNLPPVIGTYLDEKYILLDGFHRVLLYMKDDNYKPKFICVSD